MRNSVTHEQPGRASSSRPLRGTHRKALIAGLVAVGVLFAQQPARAQTCDLPPLNETLCQDKTGGTIDDYIDCYRALYDTAVIPGYTAIAKCSHVKAEK